jgi:hypothetical protein
VGRCDLLVRFGRLSGEGVVVEARKRGERSRFRVLGFFRGKRGGARVVGGCWLFVGA